ncbi:hypothetical protein Ddye_019623 [Dipteronia dyeriana]|uniref:Transposase MuDR plant domain-containing protein n=1 Tax=Dipteronia dyeriana TaxID=168575 RepID=A0AAD9TYS7_9ROSI|nr:hypothetical protein Ddye_019623 [Dipteronia dyeriana]
MKGKPFKQMVGSDILFQVGDTHIVGKSLRALLRDYAIQEGIMFDRVKNEPTRLTYLCKGEGCPWRIHASSMIDGGTMKIKTYNNIHECYRVYNNVEARLKWISGKFEGVVKSNPDVKIGVISDLLMENFKVTVDIQRPYKAKKRALHGLAKDHVECFKYLRKYAYTVQHCNPDGCHLKGQYKGVLLATVALDANSGVYPLAVCICEQDTKDSWCWFLKNLKQYLKYPLNRYYARHIYASFRIKHPRLDLKKIFWAASRSTNIYDYKSAIEEIGLVEEDAKISGVPCSHAMATISHASGRDTLKDRVAEFVHQSLTKNAYVQTYKSMIHPLPDLTMWPEVQAAPLIPPPLHATSGRSKLQRRREPIDRPKHSRHKKLVHPLPNQGHPLVHPLLSLHQRPNMNRKYHSS